MCCFSFWCAACRYPLSCIPIGCVGVGTASISKGEIQLAPVLEAFQVEIPAPLSVALRLMLDRLGVLGRVDSDALTPASQRSVAEACATLGRMEAAPNR